MSSEEVRFMQVPSMEEGEVGKESCSSEGEGAPRRSALRGAGCVAGVGLLALAAVFAFSTTKNLVASQATVKDAVKRFEDWQEAYPDLDKHLAPVIVTSFVPYAGYTGNLKVEGTVSVEGRGKGSDAFQSLTWQFQGGDPACAGKPLAGTANSCGFHIHKVGTSGDCSVPAGPHLFSVTPDPWAPIAYTLTAGESSVRNLKVITGVEMNQVLGSVVVVHDLQGVRIACGVLEPPILKVTGFVPYAGYTGDLLVGGRVSIRPAGQNANAAQILTWDLSGVDVECSAYKFNPTGALPNACGVHIHEGRDCAKNAGPHYFSAGLGSDPWQTVRYQTRNADGTTIERDVAVVTGLTTGSTIGRAVVVHNSTGARVACGNIVPPHLIASSFNAKPGFAKVNGWVSVSAGGAAYQSTMALEWHLTDVDPGCTEGPLDYADSCGIRIYNSTDCTAQLTAADRLFNRATLTEDPWASVAYQTYSSTTATETPVTVATGITNAQALGKAVGVHDASGALVACAILEIGGFTR